MTRRIRATLLTLAIALVGVNAGECDWVMVAVQIPDYDSAEVAGVWMHKDQGGQFLPTNHIQFTGTNVRSDAEVLDFTFHDGARDASYGFSAVVERNPANPDQVMLRILFARPGSGEYKVSTYNAQGESELSLETLEL